VVARCPVLRLEPKARAPPGEPKALRYDWQRRLEQGHWLFAVHTLLSLSLTPVTRSSLALAPPSGHSAWGGEAGAHRAQLRSMSTLASLPPFTTHPSSQRSALTRRRSASLPRVPCLTFANERVECVVGSLVQHVHRLFLLVRPMLQRMSHIVSPR
jgi:hypothetical protein